MRLVIEVTEEGDGQWRAAISELEGLVVRSGSADQACHVAIGEALSRIEDPSDVCFVCGDQEWVVKGPEEQGKRVFVRPSTIEEVVEAVRNWPKLRIVGGDTHGSWSARVDDEEALPRLEMRRLNAVVQHDVADQVVVVQAGISLTALNEKLAEHGQCIPLGAWPCAWPVGTVGGAIALNLPHVLQGQTGSWREWILGLTVVTAEGDVVKCGSKAVKNVAGYDVQRLLLGARGTLGVVVEAILRTYPLKALPEPRIVRKSELQPFRIVIQRVLPSDFAAAFEQYERAVGEPTTGTVWGNLDLEREPIRFPGDWVLRDLCGPRNLVFSDPAQILLMRRAKVLFDPAQKLNPGEMGIF